MKKPTMKSAAIFAVSAFLTASTVEAQYTEVDISAQVTANLQQYTFGTEYQLGGSQLNVAGVPFALALAPTDGPSTGIVQSPVTSFASGTANGYATGAFDYTFEVPAGTEATTLYSLANTAWGMAGDDEGSIVVTGTRGETVALDLVEGVNIRDHYNGSYVNTLSDSTVVSTYFTGGAPTESGDVRLDRQELVLPSSFDGDTIATIDFEGYANGSYDGGSAFLAALTLADVPDGGLTVALLGGALVGLQVLRRKLFV
jgi:hypothetical protein